MYYERLRHLRVSGHTLEEDLIVRVTNSLPKLCDSRAYYHEEVDHYCRGEHIIQRVAKSWQFHQDIK